MAHPMWPQTAAALNTPLSATISLAPAASHAAALYGAALLALGVTVFHHATHADNARRLLRYLTWGGTAICAYGLVEYALGNTRVLGLPKTYYPDSLTATFINRNTFATFAGLMLMANAAIFLERLGEVPSPTMARWRERVRAFINLTYTLHRRHAIAAGVCLLALILSHSRAGLACTMLGLLALWGGLIVAHRGSRVVMIPLLIIGLLAGAIGFNFIGTTLGTRLADAGGDMRFRQALYETTGRLIADAPLLGHGAGTFESAFRLYRTPSLRLDSTARIDKAHNTWLQLAAELGWPSVTAMFIAMTLVLAQLLNGLVIRKRGLVMPALGVGVVTLTVLHGLLDFSLQTPGVALMATALIATTLAQSHRNIPVPETDTTSPQWGVRIPIIGILGTIAVLAAMNSGQINAIEPALARLDDYRRGAVLSPDELRSMHATLADHASAPDAARNLALTANLMARATGDEEYAIQAHTYAHAALMENPADPYTWYRLAQVERLLNGPRAAAPALGMSLLTGPFETAMAYARLPLLADEFTFLAPDDQRLVCSTTRQLWEHGDRTALWQAIRRHATARTFVAYCLQSLPNIAPQWQRDTHTPWPWGR